jgi:large subunit ribosomal protein L15
MKDLSNLKPAKGSNQSPKRLGRGIGSGLGKTAGKGHKGQLQRAGGRVRAGFEGGQMPMYRRLPKRGFFNVFAEETCQVNLTDLAIFKAGEEVNPETLKAHGLISHSDRPVKLLGKGELKAALNVRLHHISGKAKEALEKAGGKFSQIVITTKPVTRNKMKPKRKLKSK